MTPPFHEREDLDVAEGRHQLGGRWPWDGTLGDALKTADPTIVADVVRQLRAAGFRELATFQLPEELLDDS